jgi:hypothetical protein
MQKYNKKISAVKEAKKEILLIQSQFGINAPFILYLPTEFVKSGSST